MRLCLILILLLAVSAPSQFVRVVPLEASDILRRLGQGKAPIQSANKQATLDASSSTLKAYWPCEDEEGSTQIESAVDGGLPMKVVNGSRPVVQITAC